jgi:hypothetical protein
VKASLNPRKLTKLGHGRDWAAVAFGPAGLELTTVHVEGADVSVLQQSSANVVLPEGSTDAVPQWQSAAQSIRQQFDPSEHRVVTSVNCEDVLCQILRLPAVAPDELKQMLDLQIDNITPLQLEEVVYSFEPLDVSEGQTRVLVAIARKATVNERVGALESAGLQPEIVSVDALAMFRALAQHKLLADDDKLNVLVILSDTSANVIVYSQSAPLAVRAIVLEAEGESVLREELQRTLVAAEAGQANRAMGDVTFLAQGDALKTFAENVASQLSAPSVFLTNGTVPSAGLSLCLQCAEGKPFPLNLLPEEWRQKRRTAAFRRRVIRGAIIAGAVYALALAVFLTFLGFRKAHLHRVEGEINHLQGEYRETRETQSTLVALRKQLDTTSSALEVMRDVATRLPDNVKLNYFQYKKDQTVTIKAQAPSAALALDFESRLEKSELFSKVVSPSSRSEPATGLTKFDLTRNLKSAGGAGTNP